MTMTLQTECTLSRHQDVGTFSFRDAHGMTDGENFPLRSQQSQEGKHLEITGLAVLTLSQDLK